MYYNIKIYSIYYITYKPEDRKPNKSWYIH